jgi:hypothetical protein
MITKTPEVGLTVYKSIFSYHPIYVIHEINTTGITLKLISKKTHAGHRHFYKSSKIYERYSMNDFHNKFSNDVIEMLNEEIDKLKAPYQTFINSLTGV